MGLLCDFAEYGSTPCGLVLLRLMGYSLSGFLSVLAYRKSGESIYTSKSLRSMSLYLFSSCFLLRLPEELLVKCRLCCANMFLIIVRIIICVMVW